MLSRPYSFLPNGSDPEGPRKHGTHGTHCYLNFIQRLGHLEAHSAGVWRCRVLEHLVFLVSAVALPVDEDSLPLHVVGKEPPEIEKAVADLLVGQPALWRQYGGWLAGLHPRIWEEVRRMARTAGKISV
jgi:hypothetical protein